MTTIYDLEKQVASRPWIPADLELYPGEDEGTICHGARIDYCIARAYDGDRQLTAAFIMHCCNNYMKALDALNAVADCRNADEAHDIIVNQFPELIEELETI